MSQPRAPFRYTPLKQGQIRLLQPPTNADDVSWSLITVSLHERDFDALSYTWGDQSCRCSFICNDQEFLISQNLKSALPYLATRDSFLPIWIDAVCINQSDEAEKYAQIPRMHNVYRRAVQVWVWLGDGQAYNPEVVHEAISLLPLIGGLRDELSMHSTFKPGITPHSKGLPSFASPCWRIIHELSMNPWLSRLWVVQEVALARRVRILYGTNEISWEVLGTVSQCPSLIASRMAKADGQKAPLFEIRADNRHNLFYVREYMENQIHWTERLLHMVQLVYRNLCSDPRDRIFGILGFAAEHELDQMGLRSDMTIVKLYTTFTHFLLKNNSPTNKDWWRLLEKATFVRKRPGLPSWCPDYYSLADPAAGPHIELEDPFTWGGSCPYHASINTDVAEQGENPNVIFLLGKILDTISAVYPQHPDITIYHCSAEGYKQLMFDLGIWERRIAEGVLGQPGLGKLPTYPSTVANPCDPEMIKVTLDDYWRTLVGNRTERGAHRCSYQDFCHFRLATDRLAALMNKWDINFDHALLMSANQALHSFMAECAFGAEGVLEPDGEAYETLELLTTITFHADLNSFLYGRRLFSTSKGWFGAGPDTIQLTDLVCILNCSKVAHILRQVGGSDGTLSYRFIGSAYVHGMMEGQIEGLAREEQIFRII
ncbi:heterokaryon incompatibility protein-domain-containing protein [Nemania abortiva]|nr:heterokaryon incompatibility protein-domain-containing protein [Nemania abortiva]